MSLQSGKRPLVNCRLCLGEILDDNVTLLDGIIKDMLEIILPELNFTICETPSICKGCLETLKQSYSFKSSCLEVEDKVHDFVNPGAPTFIDLKEVLKRSNDIKQISANLIVCRTCLALGENGLNTKLCSYEGDPLQNMVEKCLPEMGLELTKDPSICPLCLEQLEEQFHFIMQCLDTEAKISYYSESKGVFKSIDLHNVYLFSIYMDETDEAEKQYVDAENLENGNCDRGFSLKIEENSGHTDKPTRAIKKENSDADFVDITENAFFQDIKGKVEPHYTQPENKTNANLEDLEVHLFCRGSRRDIKPTEEVTFGISKDADGVDIITSQTSKISHSGSSSDSEVSVTQESELLAVTKVTNARGVAKKTDLDNVQPKVTSKREYKDEEDDKSEEERPKVRGRSRKCKLCNFKTKFGSRMKAHMTVNHLGKVERKIETEEEKYFKCRHCPFKTLDQGEYKLHKLQHKKEREQKCPKCSMVFVRLDFLKRHIDMHGTSQTNDGNPPKKHPPKLPGAAVPKKLLPPKPPSLNMTKPKSMKNMFNINGQILKMFKCRLCPYQTRMRSNYERHSLTHKKTSEIVTHKCKMCNFETIQKENFLAHMQTHQNEGENKVMRCFLCSFQPATEQALKQHVNQVHKSGTG